MESSTVRQVFDDLARQVVRDFIRTVVLIDDEWPERRQEADNEEAPAEGESKALTEAPQEKLGVAAGAAPASAPEADEIASESQGEVLVPPNRTREAGLELLDVERAVLEGGVLFSGFRYTAAREGAAILLARKSDVVILDWELLSDGGHAALRILRVLSSTGLHFVCIFTGHDKPSTVKEQISSDAQISNGRPAIGTAADFRIGSLIVAIRNKPGLPVDGNDLIVEPEHLFEVAMTTLAKTFNGFLQLAMLEITSRHRDQLPEMLARFDDKLDAAFLAEAIAEDSPVETNGAFLALLLDEWRALLEVSTEASPMRIMSKAGLRAFGSHLSSKVSTLGHPRILQHLNATKGDASYFQSQSKLADYHKTISNWLENGLGALGNEKKIMATRWGLLSALCHDGATVSEDTVFVPLLKLDTLFHQQAQIGSHLTQGTVVKTDKGSYFICVTPLCDADRPQRIQHIYSFLEATKQTTLNTLAEDGLCVVQDGPDVVCLRVKFKPVWSFKIPERQFQDGKIKAFAVLPLSVSKPPAETDSEVIRTAPDNYAQLTAIAQLRLDHALSLAASASATASRVGLNRVELIRSRFNPK